MALAGREDQTRIEGYLRGDSKAFGTVEGWILSHLRRRYPRLSNQHDDLCQTVHAALVTNLRAGRYEGRSALKGYVAGITHRVAIDRLRTLYRDPTVSAPTDVAEPWTADNPYRAVEIKDEAALQRRVLFSLPVSCRQLWKLALVDELSYEEIGRQLSIPPGTIKSRLWRCRRKAMAALLRLRRQPRT